MIGKIGERIHRIVGRKLRDRDIAQRFEEIASERFEVGATRMQLANFAQRVRRVLADDRIAQRIDDERLATPRSEATSASVTFSVEAHAIEVSSIRSASRMLPPASRASSNSADSSTLTPSREDEFLQPRKNHLQRDAPEIVALQPRQNRLGHLLRLGRREDELDVRRRLFERFQQAR